MANIVALLDSMWGWRGYNTPNEQAPRYYRINRENQSGRRLYRLCGSHQLLVTNCCKFVQCSAYHHGVPDLEWTESNLMFLQAERFDLLLVCGAVARRTFQVLRGEEGKFGKWLYMDHPAARRWSNETLNAKAVEISHLLEGA